MCEAHNPSTETAILYAGKAGSFFRGGANRILEIAKKIGNDSSYANLKRERASPSEVNEVMEMFSIANNKDNFLPFVMLHVLYRDRREF